MANNSNQYVDLTSNGKIFPSWVLHNFKKYKLPEIFRKEGEDPCAIETKLEIRKYQEFIGKYMGPGSPYSAILLYHGLGSGKTATSINFMNIMYNYDHNYSFIILIKAALRDDPWMKDMKIWLTRNDSNMGANMAHLEIFKNIHFVHYDSPYAGNDFLNVMKKLDTSKPIAFIIDEVHRFIQNVYSNIDSSSGRRAQIIYDYIIRTKKEIPNTKIIAISATPTVNNPFELALLFNMLRPGIFPASESEFNKIFVTKSSYPILNPRTHNMFQRRILGLVSYYIGATPDLYAKQIQKHVNLPMSSYQYEVYRFFEKIELEIEQRAKRFRKQSKIFKTYTRQASNFVFPNINSKINGKLRPRPKDYRLGSSMINDISKGKIPTQNKEKLEAAKQYISALNVFIRESEIYFNQIHKKDEVLKWTIFDDLNKFKKNITKYNDSFFDYYESKTKKSKLFHILYESSPKILAIVFMSFISTGKVMVYTNYVVGEGIEILKIYYRLCGFNDFTQAKPNLGYCEYHGGISKDEKIRIKKYFNADENLMGNKCKIILLSPSGSEGIELIAIIQEHILEPYWNEVRVKQVIGRGVRQCSHKGLPMKDRIVNIYRYRVIKPTVLDPDDLIMYSTDEQIEDSARSKNNLLESFTAAMEEAAVDCGLFAAHNKMTKQYTCFAFPEKSLLTRHIGPAYEKDIMNDIKYNYGLNAPNSSVMRIKVVKINAAYALINDSSKYSEPYVYWYHQDTGMVYDYETHYPVGRINMINGLPNKLDKTTYIISDLIEIPSISNVTNNP